MSSAEILAGFVALLTPLGALAGVIYTMMRGRIRRQAVFIKELQALMWEMSSENKELREKMGELVRRSAE